jgi:hypothetical protein
MLGCLGRYDYAKVYERPGLSRYGVVQFGSPHLLGMANLAGPGALSSQILKSVYFTEGDFLEAPIGPNPSQTWRSIIKGRDTLVQGLIKRIGTGVDSGRAGGF